MHRPGTGGADSKPMSIFGETLRQARADKGVTIKEAEQATRINRLHLAALEDERFEALPPLIYQRGIVRNYATYLDLDPNKLLAMFEEARGAAADPTEVVAAVKPLDMPSHWAPNFAIIAFMVVMCAIVFAWIYSAYFATGDSLPTPTSPISTVTPIPTSQVAVAGPASTRPPKPKTPTPSGAASPNAGASDQASLPISDAANPTETPTVAPTATAAPTAAPTNTPAGDQGQASGAGQAGQSSQSQSSQASQPTPPPAPSGNQITLSVYSDAPIYVSVYVDGVVQFDGNLAAGQSAGTFTGSTFEIYTSSGVHTWFKNLTTGESPFLMSYSTGETTINLP